MIDCSLHPVVIVASGPSLSDEQCALIESRSLDEACKTIVVNDCYRRIPGDCIDVVYAADGQWWNTYLPDVNVETSLDTELWTADPSLRERGINYIQTKIGQGLAPEVEPHIYRHHSGAHQAVGLAVKWGATHIILVGVDCKKSADGKVHWFGDHPKKFRAPQPMDLWIQDWAGIAASARARHIDIVNCSLDTAVNCFRRSTLEKELFA